MGTQGRDGNSFTLTAEPGGSTHFLTVSVKGGEVRIESYGGKWWKLMCVKHPAEGGDYPSSEVVFLDRERLSGIGVQEHMAPLLSHPLTLPPPPPLLSF